MANADTEYKKGNYEKSLVILKALSVDDSLYLFALWLEGCNHYKLDNFEDAQSAFDKLIRLQDQKLGYEEPDLVNVNWIRILSVLAQWNEKKDGDLKKELDRLLSNFLSNLDPPPKYYERAIKLQEMLR